PVRSNAPLIRQLARHGRGGSSLSCGHTVSCARNRPANDWCPMNRDDVMEAVRSAHTLPACEAAGRLVRQWMRQHPDDIGMQDVGESLAMMREALSPPEEVSEFEARRNRTRGAASHSAARTERDAYAVPFEEEVRLAQAEFGWDEAEARAFVASYRPAPILREPADAQREEGMPEGTPTPAPTRILR